VSDAIEETTFMTLTLDLAEKAVQAGRVHASMLGVAACLVVCDVTFAGGIPLRSATGELLGAVGVSGGQVVQDYAIAKAAVDVLGTA
jgi:uncharacterized protein GlcG (DUF336 family)